MNQIWVIVLTLLWMVALWEFVGNEFKHIEKFFRWLKGTRKTYFIDYNNMTHETTDKLRGFHDFIHLGSITGTTVGSGIEIGRGFLRRRSAIYGLAEKNWQLIKASVNDGCCGVVELRDKQGVILEDALHLINTYPSLQAMLDRIAELEHQLNESEYINQGTREGISAILSLINEDRQKYRSKAAENIRVWLERLATAYKLKNHAEPKPTQVEAWKRTFKYESVGNVSDSVTKK